MATIGLEICLIISAAVVIIMASKNYENINSYDWAIVLLIPIVILGYWLKSRVTTSEAAELALCFICIDSSVLLMVTIFAMLHSLRVMIRPWGKLVGYGIALLHALSVWISFGTRLFYKSLKVTQTTNGAMTQAALGPLKIVHLVYLLLNVGIIIAILISGYVKKGTHSRIVLYNYSVIAGLFIVIYAGEYSIEANFIKTDFTVLPYLYVLSSIIIMTSYDHTHMHDISCVISQHQIYHSNRGYVAVDMHNRFESCNEKAFEFMPFLRNQRVDEVISKDNPILDEMIEAFKTEGISSRKFSIGDIICICEIDEFSLKKDGKIQGYIFDIRDATEEQRAMEIMTSYNETLSREIERKTENIVGIQRKITLGMANIIENRDDNTGGHVKRTSDIISILIDEIMKMPNAKISATLAEDIVRAAPLHDLGKISIDSFILCKPGRLTNEEYAIMKTHSTKSGEMVHILLDGVEEQHFVDTAYNIARYHHERWDGKGYPEGRVGSMIPIEARIMAIADVYDALVSKRCYKEAMSYDKAKDIMIEGMGTQFDPNMEKIFLECCDKLEAYYRSIQ